MAIKTIVSRSFEEVEDVLAIVVLINTCFNDGETSQTTY